MHIIPSYHDTNTNMEIGMYTDFSTWGRAWLERQASRKCWLGSMIVGCWQKKGRSLEARKEARLGFEEIEQGKDWNIIIKRRKIRLEDHIWWGHEGNKANNHTKSYQGHLMGKHYEIHSQNLGPPLVVSGVRFLAKIWDHL